MSKILCTFSGEYGDILWSLPTVRAVAQITDGKVDFACMPDYVSLLPLIQAQPYIDKAFVIPEWIKWHSNHGAQPWHPPKAQTNDIYERCFHLTYQSHPGLGGARLPLIDFTAHQQGMKLKDPLPFLFVPFVEEDKCGDVEFKRLCDGVVAVAFNAQYVELKKQFMDELYRHPKMKRTGFVDTTVYPWLEAAKEIKNATCFIGCRSSNYVIANGVGQKNIFTFEPHPARNMYGQLGDIFGCPYNSEVSAPTNMPVSAQVEMAAQHIEEWLKQSKGEKVA